MHSSTGSPVLLSDELDSPALVDVVSAPLELVASVGSVVAGIVVDDGPPLVLDSLLLPVPSAAVESSLLQALAPRTAPIPCIARRRDSRPRIKSKSFRRTRPLAKEGNADVTRVGAR
jgi:hypothetical protein